LIPNHPCARRRGSSCQAPTDRAGQWWCHCQVRTTGFAGGAAATIWRDVARRRACGN
jgi:hypothetical protein